MRRSSSAASPLTASFTRLALLCASHRAGAPGQQIQWEAAGKRRGGRRGCEERGECAHQASPIMESSWPQLWLHIVAPSAPLHSDAWLRSGTQTGLTKHRPRPPSIHTTHHYVSHDRPAHKAVDHRRHVGVLFRIAQSDVVDLDVHVLIDRVQRAGDAQVVLQLHGYLQKEAGQRSSGVASARDRAGDSVPLHCTRTSAFLTTVAIVTHLLAHNRLEKAVEQHGFGRPQAAGHQPRPGAPMEYGACMPVR